MRVRVRKDAENTYPGSTAGLLWSVWRRSLMLHRTCLKLISPQRAPSPHASVWNNLMNTSATGTRSACKGPISVLWLFSGTRQKGTNKGRQNNETPLDAKKRVCVGSVIIITINLPLNPPWTAVLVCLKVSPIDRQTDTPSDEDDTKNLSLSLSRRMRGGLHQMEGKHGHQTKRISTWGRAKLCFNPLDWWWSSFSAMHCTMQIVS